LSGDATALDCRRDLRVTRWPLPGQSPCDAVAEEVPVALSYNGVAHVVMMMTPADLEDFACGFSLSEAVIEHLSEIHAVDVLKHPEGHELAATISGQRFAMLKQVRRNLVGRTGCGLCGAESLGQAIRPVPRVGEGVRIPAAAIDRALAALGALQPLQRATGATHGAAWCDVSGDILCVREDVGRHNALDKLIGALARGREKPPEGFALVSSRASYEMVAKAARAGMQVLVAVSAPTTLAVELAGKSGLTLAGFARPGRFSVYNAAQRIGF
jgi:FdhD protein